MAQGERPVMVPQEGARLECRDQDNQPSRTPPETLLEQALCFHRAGRLQEAQTLYEHILAQAPGHADALHLRGTIAHQAGDHELACEHILRALETDPGVPLFHNSLGNVLRDMGRREAAHACYREALRLWPDYADAHYNLGLLLKTRGEVESALRHFQEALENKPDFAEARNNLGILLGGQGRFQEAADHFRAALGSRPDFPEVCNNLGAALRELGRPKEALGHCKRALELRRDYPEAHHNLGLILKEQGAMGAAITHIREALRLNPALAEAHNSLGTAMLAKNRVTEALDCFRKAVALRADFAAAHSNLLHNLHYRSTDPEALFLEHRRWARQHAQAPAAPLQRHPNDPDSQRRLRIGYVSPDLRVHPVGLFFEPLLRAHDRSAFEVICYSDVSRPDTLTARLKSRAEHWRDIRGMLDEQVEAMIRQDRVDILVDLAGHTTGNRMPLFTRKPAPLQVSYLGYPDTSGLDAMDYRMTDGYADPVGQTDHLHAETLLRPHCSFLCYCPPEGSPSVVPPPALRTGKITFGTFNNICKMSPQIIDIWTKILGALPDCQLIIKSPLLQDEEVRDRLRTLFGRSGVAAERLLLMGPVPSAHDHLKGYGSVDIALDTFPYHGTATTCEALWMGVPVITLAGRHHVARVGVSILTNLGLTDLIAESPERFLQKALDLAQDLPRLTRLRAGLRKIMAQSPLTDSHAFTRAIEKAYRRVWRRWCG